MVFDGKLHVHQDFCGVLLHFYIHMISTKVSTKTCKLVHQGCDKRRPDLSITVPWVTWKNTSATVRKTVGLGQHWHHLHMGNSWYVSWNFITDDHWSGIWLLDQNLSFWSKFCLHETLQPRFTPQCRMGYGFCCPNTTWRSCVGSHVWHRNALDRSTTLRTCHWSPGMCLRWLGWLYVRTIAWSTIQPKIDWIRHDYNWLRIVYRITYNHSIIFYVQFCCFIKSNMLTLRSMIFIGQVLLNQQSLRLLQLDFQHHMTFGPGTDISADMLLSFALVAQWKCWELGMT